MIRVGLKSCRLRCKSSWVRLSTHVVTAFVDLFKICPAIVAKDLYNFLVDHELCRIQKLLNSNFQFVLQASDLGPDLTRRTGLGDVDVCPKLLLLPKQSLPRPKVIMSPIGYLEQT